MPDADRANGERSRRDFLLGAGSIVGAVSAAPAWAR